MLFVKKRGKIIIVEPLRDDISKTNIVFAFLARTLATTWEDKKKIKKNLNLKVNFINYSRNIPILHLIKGMINLLLITL